MGNAVSQPPVVMRRFIPDINIRTPTVNNAVEVTSSGVSTSIGKYASMIGHQLSRSRSKRVRVRANICDHRQYSVVLDSDIPLRSINQYTDLS